MHIIALRIKLQLSRRQPFLKDHDINSGILLDAGSSSLQCIQSPPSLCICQLWLAGGSKLPHC